jgi:endonuclease/exonuclease/phosphatase family metal-dependent hydrolase
MHRLPPVLLTAVFLLSGGAGAETPRALRLVTFNLLHGGFSVGGGGDGQHLEERLAMTTEELRSLAPDVIGLQEASAGGTRGDVAARLGAALGVHHVRAPAGYRWIGRLAALAIGFDEGPAIVSRFPITSWEALPVSPCDQWYGRVLLCAVVATPWGPLDVCSTHLAGNDCQLDAMAALLRDRRHRMPRVLTGDLNTTSEAPGMRRLLDGGGLLDTFRAANPEAPGLTVWQPVRAEKPAVRRRVDFILVARGDGQAPQVRASRLVLDTPRRAGDGKPLWPSDHYGVLTEVDLF